MSNKEKLKEWLEKTEKYKDMDGRFYLFLEIPCSYENSKTAYSHKKVFLGDNGEDLKNFNYDHLIESLDLDNNIGIIKNVVSGNVFHVVDRKTIALVEAKAIKEFMKNQNDFIDRFLDLLFENFLVEYNVFTREYDFVFLIKGDSERTVLEYNDIQRIRDCLGLIYTQKMKELEKGDKIQIEDLLSEKNFFLEW